MLQLTLNRQLKSFPGMGYYAGSPNLKTYIAYDKPLYIIMFISSVPVWLCLVYLRQFCVRRWQKQYIPLCLLVTSESRKHLKQKMNRLMTKSTVWLCAQLRLRSAWASTQSSLCAQWVAKDPSFLHADSKTLNRLGGCPG